jgi:hypothetical protein
METLAPASDPLASKSQIAREEKKLRELQARLEQLEKHVRPRIYRSWAESDKA